MDMEKIAWQAIAENKRMLRSQTMGKQLQQAEATTENFLATHMRQARVERIA